MMAYRLFRDPFAAPPREQFDDSCGHTGQFQLILSYCPAFVMQDEMKMVNS